MNHLSGAGFSVTGLEVASGHRCRVTTTVDGAAAEIDGALDALGAARKATA